MRNYLSAYAPSLGELWLIMLALLCLGGSILSAGAVFVLSFFIKVDQVLLSLVFYPLLFGLVIPFIWLRAKDSFQEKVRRGQEIPRALPHSFGSLPGALFFILLLVLIPAFSIIIEPLTMWMKMPDFLKELFGSIGNYGWISVFSLVIMAPLLEEWLCRGVALNGLLKNGYSPAAAIAWSAAMFAVIHLNPWQSIPAFFMGLLFGWVYWRTRSLWSVIFLHAVNNGLSVAITWIFPHLPKEASTFEMVGPAVYYWLLAASLIITPSILFVLHKKLKPAAPLFKRASLS